MSDYENWYNKPENINWWESYSPHKLVITEAPDFSGLDPETYLPWDPNKVVKILDLKLNNNVDDIITACNKIINEYPDQAEKYRSGNKKIIGFFMKNALQELKGSADPKLVNQTLRQILDGEK